LLGKNADFTIENNDGASPLELATDVNVIAALKAAGAGSVFN